MEHYGGRRKKVKTTVMRKFERWWWWALWGRGGTGEEEMEEGRMERLLEGRLGNFEAAAWVGV